MEKRFIFPAIILLILIAGCNGDFDAITGSVTIYESYEETDNNEVESEDKAKNADSNGINTEQNKAFG